MSNARSALTWPRREVRPGQTQAARLRAPAHEQQREIVVRICKAWLETGAGPMYKILPTDTHASPTVGGTSGAIGVQNVPLRVPSAPSVQSAARDAQIVQRRWKRL